MRNKTEVQLGRNLLASRPDQATLRAQQKSNSTIVHAFVAVVGPKTSADLILARLVPYQLSSLAIAVA